MWWVHSEYHRNKLRKNKQYEALSICPWKFEKIKAFIRSEKNLFWYLGSKFYNLIDRDHSPKFIKIVHECYWWLKTKSYTAKRNKQKVKRQNQDIIWKSCKIYFRWLEQ